MSSFGLLKTTEQISSFTFHPSPPPKGGNKKVKGKPHPHEGTHIHIPLDVYRVRTSPG